MTRVRVGILALLDHKMADAGSATTTTKSGGLVKLGATQERPSDVSANRCEGSPQEQGANITKLKRCGEHHHGQNCSRPGIVCHDERQGDRTGDNERQQDENPEPNAQERSNQPAANRQNNHLTHAPENAERVPRES